MRAWTSSASLDQPWWTAPQLDTNTDGSPRARARQHGAFWTPAVKDLPTYKR